MIHHAFVVRICANSQGSWHGQVVHTASQQQETFVELDTLIEFMRTQMNAVLLNASENDGIEIQVLADSGSGGDKSA